MFLRNSNYNVLDRFEGFRFLEWFLMRAKKAMYIYICLISGFWVKILTCEEVKEKAETVTKDMELFGFPISENVAPYMGGILFVLGIGIYFLVRRSYGSDGIGGMGMTATGVDPRYTEYLRLKKIVAEKNKLFLESCSTKIDEDARLEDFLGAKKVLRDFVCEWKLENPDINLEVVQLPTVDQEAMDAVVAFLEKCANQAH